MKHHVPGLYAETELQEPLREWIFLVQVFQARYQRNRDKPFFVLSFRVLEPREPAGKTVTGRIYCTPHALWKLRWFLRDFGYDTHLTDQEVVDEKLLVGLQGVIKTSSTNTNGRSFLNLDAFAPAVSWQQSSGQQRCSVESGHGV